MKKRILSFFLAAAMIMTLVSGAAMAAASDTNDYVSIKVAGNKIIITTGSQYSVSTDDICVFAHNKDLFFTFYSYDDLIMPGATDDNLIPLTPANFYTEKLTGVSGQGTTREVTIPTTSTQETWVFAVYSQGSSTDVAITTKDILNGKVVMPKCTITWNANGGTVNADPATTTVEQGAVITLPATPPTRPGYQFTNWTNATSGGIVIKDGVSKAPETATVTYYAQWAEKTAPTAANFQVAGATFTGAAQAPVVTANAGVTGMGAITVTSASVTNAGTYDVSINVAEGAGYKAASNLILTGAFTISPATPTVEKRTASGSSGSVSFADLFTIQGLGGADITSDYQNLTYALTATTIPGATAKADRSGVENITAGGTVTFTVTGTNTSGNYTSLSAITVTADVSYASYTVNYDANKPYASATPGGTPTVPTTATPGTAALAAANTDTFTGYTFAGWNTTADGTGTAVAVNGAVPGSAALTDGEAITLYAQWTANELVFADLSLTDSAALTVGVSHTFTDALTASNGTGSYTYSILTDPANIAGASITNSNHITVLPTATAPKTVRVRATDENSGKTADCTITFAGTINKAALTLTPNLALSGTTSDSFTLADFLTSAAPLFGSATKQSLFGDSLSVLTAGAFSAKGVSIQFYDDNTYTTTTNTATWTAMPNQPGTYYYSVAVAPNASVSDDYQTDATGLAETKTGVLTLAAIPSGGGGSSSYTVSYDVGDHGTFAQTDSSTERVSRNEYPKNVPDVTPKEGFRFLGWSLDGATTIDPTQHKITQRTTFTALYAETSKPVGFDKTHTTPYIKGVEADGALLFKPDAAITRAEVAAIIARNLTLEMDDAKNYYDGQFPDVTGDEWYAQYAGFLADLGIITGVEDGSFAPDAFISRAEFLTMVIRVDGLVNTTQAFPDVDSSHWAYSFISAGLEKGLAKGYEDGLFHPGDLITRASVVTMMNRVLGWGWDPQGQMLFTDVNADHWAYQDILRASNGK